MWTPAVLVIATTTLVGCAVLGGAVYEALVVDPFWPKRPGIVQPRNGGISRARFWRPAHLAFDVLLVVSLVAGWGDPDVRAALLVAVAGHVVVRIWSPRKLLCTKGRTPPMSMRWLQSGGRDAVCCSCRCM